MAASPALPLMTAEAFRQQTDVSRETFEKLEMYAALLVKWQKAINLVGKSTLPDLWRRHMLDSFQLLSFVPAKKDLSWLDLGSGAGFPALVVAICGVGNMHVVESDGRKCSFMREVARQTDTRLTIHNCRIEKLAPVPMDVISARALASLSELLEYAEPFATEKTQFLFLKGQDVDEELTKATKCWNMSLDRHQSLSNEKGCILHLRQLSRR